MGDIICLSHLRWDFVWQRPQHLLARFARTERVLFVEEPITVTPDEASEPRLEIIPGKGAQNVTVARLITPQPEQGWIGHGDPRTQETYSRLLREYAKQNGYDQPVLWLYTPMASEFIDTINHNLLVVDVMDQLSAFKGAPPELIQREKDVLKQADIVFTGGASLYRDKLPHNPNTHLFPSGVDAAHFAQAASPENFEEPAELANLPRPILGYYGVIDERMDINTIAEAAQAKPAWSIVLIGPVVKISRDELPQLPNLHYIDMKTYDELPSYLSRFDVAMIPFAVNEATRFLSPTKTLEYMAAHKPIVSAPIHDVMELYGDVVRIAYNPTDFVSQAESALAENPEWRLTTENRLLSENTWDSIANRMRDIMMTALNSVSANANPKQSSGTKSVQKVA